MNNLKEALCEINDGRFEQIINVLKVTDTCSKCDSFNLSINDPRQGYRCACIPSCIAVTLNADLISYLNWKLNWISAEEHINNGQKL